MLYDMKFSLRYHRMISDSVNAVKDSFCQSMEQCLRYRTCFFFFFFLIFYFFFFFLFFFFFFFFSSFHPNTPFSKRSAARNFHMRIVVASSKSFSVCNFRSLLEKFFRTLIFIRSYFSQSCSASVLSLRSLASGMMTQTRRRNACF